jgi:hypothetical protein
MTETESGSTELTGMKRGSTTLCELWASSVAVIRQKGMLLLTWGILALLLCLPCALYFSANVLTSSGAPGGPVSAWDSLPALDKLTSLVAVWFMTFGVMGLTQAVASLATGDVCLRQPTTARSLARRLMPKLARVLALQVLTFLTVFTVLLVVLFFPLTIFAIPGILIDNYDLSKAVAVSANMVFQNLGKVISILLMALAVVFVWVHIQGPVMSGTGSLIAALNVEARVAVLYLGGILINIPITILYFRGREQFLPSPPN